LVSVAHTLSPTAQIDSYNECLSVTIPEIVASPDSRVVIPFDFDSATSQPRRIYKLFWGDLSIGRPVLQESNGVATLLTPAEARRRNITYSANLYVDVRHEMHIKNDAGTWLEPEVQEVKRILISKLPLMIGASSGGESVLIRDFLYRFRDIPSGRLSTQRST
jgi:DNA-directed RNA polymerase II subunit RPB2